jgi:hypothetical protein
MRWSSSEDQQEEEDPTWNVKTGLSAEYGFHPGRAEWQSGFKVDIKFDKKQAIYGAIVKKNGQETCNWVSRVAFGCKKSAD